MEATGESTLASVSGQSAPPLVGNSAIPLHHLGRYVVRIFVYTSEFLKRRAFA